jgi:hypothetical protein
MLPTCRGAPRTVALDPLDREQEFMGCVVEVSLTEDDLVGQMNHMRAWLDHRRFEPSSFTLSPGSGPKVVRVLFRSESEAAAFAAEFGGRPLFSTASAHVAA